MGTEKRQRQKEGRQARIAAAEAAQHRAARRRKYITFAVMAVGVLAVFALINFLTKKDTKKSVATTNTTSSTTAGTTPATLASVAGKPCVAMQGTPPKGAPSVPVEVGPPPTKLVTKDLKVGTGATIEAANTSSIDYIGVACSTGKIFDSSYSRGTPFVTSLDSGAQVIDGWKQGIPGMKIGGSRLLGIPASLAYGPNPTPGSGIAPDETLWFVVDAVKTTPPTATTATPSGAPATTAASQ